MTNTHEKTPQPPMSKMETALNRLAQIYEVQIGELAKAGRLNRYEVSGLTGEMRAVMNELSLDSHIEERDVAELAKQLEEFRGKNAELQNEVDRLTEENTILLESEGVEHE